MRELESSDDADDPDMSEAVALSLVEEGEPSHEEILEIIRKNGGSASTSKKSKPELDTFVIDDASDDEVVLIPTASLFSSNRLGGKSIKTEINEELSCQVLTQIVKCLKSIKLLLMTCLQISSLTPLMLLSLTQLF